MKNHLGIIAIIISTVSGGIGSILAMHNYTLGIVLIIVGIAFGTYKIISDKIRNDVLSQTIETQNMLLASSGAGNVYQEIVESELKQKGESAKGIELLKKAYSIDPNNIEVIKKLSGFLALKLSTSGWANLYSGNMKLNQDWIFAKQLVERGLKINSKERVLMDILGILYDIVGENELARKWFIHSSKYRQDPYWHLLISVSWGMSGNFQKSIKEVELAINKAGHNWLTDLYYGMALEIGGKCEESLKYLDRVQKVKGMHPGVSFFRISARTTLGRFSHICVLDTLYLTFFLLSTQRQSLKRVIGINIEFWLCINETFVRKLWSIACKPCLPKRLRNTLPPPGMKAFIQGLSLMKIGDYATAKNFYEICFSICSKYIPTLINLAGCYAALGDRDKAIETIDLGLLIEPSNELLIFKKKQYLSGIKLRTIFLSQKDFNTGHKNSKEEHD